MRVFETFEPNRALKRPKIIDYLGERTMVTQTQPAKRRSAARTLFSSEHRESVIGLQRVADALVEAGYITLDAQAKALGVKRSTAWTIIRVKHKLGRLSAKTRTSILTNPHLPAQVRAAFLEYVSSRSLS